MLILISSSKSIKVEECSPTNSPNNKCESRIQPQTAKACADHRRSETAVYLRLREREEKMGEETRMGGKEFGKCRKFRKEN